MATKKPTQLTPEILRRKVVMLCEDANALGDLIKELSPEARDPHQALSLAAKAHEIAVLAIGPTLFGHAFVQLASECLGDRQ
jgi:hypothetical protein